jgi:hypothetical protein
MRIISHYKQSACVDHYFSAASGTTIALITGFCIGSRPGAFRADLWPQEYMP